MKPVNPFAPPFSDLTLPAEMAVPRKPLSVWFVQIIGGLLAGWCTLGLVRISFGAYAGAAISGFGIPIGLHLALQTCVVGFMLLMLWHLPKRSKLGRNLGLGFIALIGTPIVILTFTTFVTGMLEAGVIAASLVVAPFAYLAFAFAYSDKSRRYFGATGPA